MHGDCSKPYKIRLLLKKTYVVYLGILVYVKEKEKCLLFHM